jgi:hypothetical protein
MIETKSGVGRFFNPTETLMNTKKRVLLVEDNEATIDVVGMELNFLGYEVTIAKDGLISSCPRWTGLKLSVRSGPIPRVAIFPY